MESGSSPQYLVLAEMQRRKKMREDSAQANPQSDRSVAEDIMGGITQVPMGPMEMAEGGIVSFAKGGKTGRAKGEEEACYVDSRTGEKYCPPGTPQTEMPRTGQRKSFQEGGVIPSSEMADIDLQRARQMYEANLEDLRRADPNVDFETFLQSYNAVGAQTSPATPSPQPESLGSIEDSPVEEDRPMSRYERIAAQAEEEGISGLFGGLFGGSEEKEEPEAPDPYEGMSPRQKVAAQAKEEGLAEGVFSNFFGIDFTSPEWRGRSADESVPTEELSRYGQIARQTQEFFDSEDEPETQGEGTSPARPGGERNQFTGPTGDKTPDDTPDDTPVAQDGLAELMRDLQAERQELREGSREDAINQALIRAGLTMAASDDPDFLSAAAEGGIGGLAGYQSAMERAAQRQGEISSDVIDLGIARETAALKQRAAQAAIENRISDEEAARIKSLIDFRSTLADQLAESLGDEEASAELQRQIDAIDAQLAPAMGTGSAAQNFEYDPSNYGT